METYIYLFQLRNKEIVLRHTRDCASRTPMMTMRNKTEKLCGRRLTFVCCVKQDQAYTCLYTLNKGYIPYHTIPSYYTIPCCHCCNNNTITICSQPPTTWPSGATRSVAALCGSKNKSNKPTTLTHSRAPYSVRPTTRLLVNIVS